jgi:5-methylcytosine-specific restriction endonuclease McrA
MIMLPAVALDTTVATRLTAFQTQISSATSYAVAVSEAKRLFALRNTASNRTFRAVRAALASMCSGARRCCYCEDSCADEVEHIKPKDLYPHLVFVWENYVYACGPCNGPKNNKFRIFHPRAGTVLDISRKVGDPVRKPPNGDQ